MKNNDSRQFLLKREKNMKPEISIIIPDSANTTYLARCLNSIKRQTISDYEIIISSEEQALPVPETYHDISICSGGLKEAADSAKGDYVFFLSITSLLTENVLEDLLVKTKENPDSCFCACLLGKGNNVFTYAKGAVFSIYGTLFEKAGFAKAAESGAGLSAVAEYLGSFKKVILDEDALIYETDPACVYPYIPMDEKSFEGWMEALGDADVPGIEVYAYFEKCSADSVSSAEKLKIAAVFAKNFSDALESNYLLVKDCLKEVYRESRENEDESSYEAVKGYISLWKDNPVFLAMLLELIGVSRKKQDAFFTSSLKDFEFYDSYITEDDEKEALNFKELEQRMDKLEKNLKNLPAEGAKEKVPAGNYSQAPDMTKYLIGQDLADLVVRKYAEGSLGLGTLIKAFKAWFRFKMKKGKA